LGIYLRAFYTCALSFRSLTYLCVVLADVLFVVQLELSLTPAELLNVLDAKPETHSITTMEQQLQTVLMGR
jgi:hypothetical protein